MRNIRPLLTYTIFWAAMIAVAQASSADAIDSKSEKEEPPPVVDCSLSTCPDFGAQGFALYEFLDASLPEAYDFAVDDIDGQGILDQYEVALFQHLVCHASSSFGTALECIFQDNRGKFQQEPGYFLFAEFEDTYTALITTSTEHFVALGGGALQRQYEVFHGNSKASGEPLSAQGDLDADGVSNLQEYQNTLANGGGVDEYVEAALNPLLDGSNTEGLPIAGFAGLGGLVLALGGVGVIHARKRG